MTTQHIITTSVAALAGITENIESCDPGGTYFGDRSPNDNCDYDSDGTGSKDKNRATGGKRHILESGIPAGLRTHSR